MGTEQPGVPVALVLDLDSLPPAEGPRLPDTYRRLATNVQAPLVVAVTCDPHTAANVRQLLPEARVYVVHPNTTPTAVLGSVVGTLAADGYRVHLMSNDPDLGPRWKGVHTRTCGDQFTGRQALLIDLENIGPRSKHAGPFLDRLLETAGEVDTAVAAASKEVLDRYTPLCAARGITLLRAGPERNAADVALIAHAKQLHHRRYTAFIVASADHSLAQVPGQVTVLLPQHTPCSRRLADRALAVQRF